MVQPTHLSKKISGGQREEGHGVVHHLQQEYHQSYFLGGPNYFFLGGGRNFFGVGANFLGGESDSFFGGERYNFFEGGSNCQALVPNPKPISPQSLQTQFQPSPAQFETQINPKDSRADTKIL